MTEILMIRHGQSVWNAQGRWQGQANPPLSPLGREQADAAGAYLAEHAAELAFDGMATSTLDRAATTGSIIAGHVGFDHVYRCADLVERNAGEWSGLTRPEIDERYPGFLRAKKYPPGYEHDDDLMVRIRRGLTEVIENVPGNRLIVVAHGGIIYRIESSLGLPFRHLQNLGARSLSFDGETFELGERYDLLADFAGEHTTPTAI
jgi:probable phosphoglycerate mutase